MSYKKEAALLGARVAVIILLSIGVLMVEAWI
jgi:hypothetical protein